VAETFATSGNITAGGAGVQIAVSDCPVAEPKMPVAWLVERAMYGAPSFTDVTEPAISPGSTAIAEVATPDYFTPPTNSVRYVLVTWADGIIVATVLVIAHTPFPPYASLNGAETLARAQDARLRTFTAVLERCALAPRGVDPQCGLA
jgi:hypothetical protein